MLHSPSLAMQPQRCLPAHTVHKPTYSAHCSIRFCCLAGRGRLSQLSWPCFTPTGCWGVPAGASPKNSLLPISIQAQYCMTRPAPELHNSPVHHINPEILPSLQGRQRVAPSTMISAEASAMITKVAEANSQHSRLRPLPVDRQKGGHAHCIPTATGAPVK